jgi:hypothetical protein
MHGPAPLQLAGQLRSLHKLPVSYVALDWHQMDKELGSEALVEAFWTQLSALLPPQVSSCGALPAMRTPVCICL